jgi:hypothetical protein
MDTRSLPETDIWVIAMKLLTVIQIIQYGLTDVVQAKTSLAQTLHVTLLLSVRKSAKEENVT